MRCPKCIEYNLPDSHYCSQECFRASFNEHKPLHTGRYDFGRAFARTQYTKQWWQMMREGYVVYWDHLCTEQVDLELIDRSVMVCQHLCDSEQMEHLPKPNQKILKKSLAAFKAIYERIKGNANRTEFVCLLLDAFCNVEFLPNEASEDEKAAHLSKQWSSKGTNSPLGACLKTIAPLMMLKIEGDGDTSLAAFMGHEERIRFLSEFVLPIFEVLHFSPPFGFTAIDLRFNIWLSKQVLSRQLLRDYADPRPLQMQSQLVANLGNLAAQAASQQ
jgi:hypothetical protein